MNFCKMSQNIISVVFSKEEQKLDSETAFSKPTLTFSVFLNWKHFLSFAQKWGGLVACRSMYHTGFLLSGVI